MEPPRGTDWFRSAEWGSSLPWSTVGGRLRLGGWVLGFGRCAGEGDEHAGGLAGGGQLALGGGFLEGLVAVAVGAGAGRERGPGRVGEDALGVVGDGCSYVADQKAAGLLPGRPGREFGERQGEGQVGGCLEVLDGLSGGVGLVGVVLRIVPAPGDGWRPRRGLPPGKPARCPRGRWRCAADRWASGTPRRRASGIGYPCTAQSLGLSPARRVYFQMDETRAHRALPASRRSEVAVPEYLQVLLRSPLAEKEPSPIVSFRKRSSVEVKVRLEKVLAAWSPTRLLHRERDAEEKMRRGCSLPCISKPPICWWGWPGEAR